MKQVILLGMLLVALAGGCKENDEKNSGGLSLEIDSAQLSHCCNFAGEVVTSNLTEDAILFLNNSGQIQIEGSASDTSINEGSYQLATECQSVTGTFSLSNGSFTFSHPVGDDQLVEVGALAGCTDGIQVPTTLTLTVQSSSGSSASEDFSVLIDENTIIN